MRERLAFAGDSLTEGLRLLGSEVDEGMILSTCNRTEIYAVQQGEGDPREQVFRFLSNFHSVPTHVLEHASYAKSGPEAVSHLFRVASGLDSLVLGEPQILTQIRQALAEAREAKSVGSVLQRLATDALRIGKRARTETNIARNRMSIAHAAVDLAVHELGILSGQSVVLVGAGEMASLTGKLLRTHDVRDLTIINRSLDRAQELARAIDAQAIPVSGLPRAIADADLVIGAVTVHEPVVRPSHIRPRTKPVLIVDISVPRSIATECDSLDGVHVRDVDALEVLAAETRRQYADEVGKVEALVDAAVADFTHWTRTRAGARAITAYCERNDGVRDVEVERALRRLGHLSERDRNVVRALGHAISGKLAHDPIVALRKAESEDEIMHILRVQGVEPD